MSIFVFGRRDGDSVGIAARDLEALLILVEGCLAA